MTSSRLGSEAASQQTPRTKTFPPLDTESRPTVETAAAAYYLNRQEQTLRAWACRSGSGPLTPKRVHGRLAWPVAGIKALLGVA
jgi:hypothetical protein